MLSGISMRSLAICCRRALSSRFSGEPGAYARTGSFTGIGTRRMPVKPTMPPPVTVGWDGVAGTGASCSLALAAVDFGGGATGADIHAPRDDRHSPAALRRAGLER